VSLPVELTFYAELVTRFFKFNFQLVAYGTCIYSPLYGYCTLAFIVSYFLNDDLGLVLYVLFIHGLLEYDFLLYV